MSRAAHRPPASSRTEASGEPACVLLVHGGWHGSWCWERVAPLLAERGIAVSTVDLPSCGRDVERLGDLAADAAAVRAALASLPGPAVVCGHSWGGVVVTEAVADELRVRRLVYLGAYVPDVGESVASLRRGRPARPWILAGSGVLEVDPSAARDVLYHDCDPALAAWAAERLVPQNAACACQAASRAAWRSLPSTYVLTTNDRVIEPDLQRRLATRASETVELPTGHSPFLARPDLVAALLARLARDATAGEGSPRAPHGPRAIG